VLSIYGFWFLFFSLSFAFHYLRL